MMAIEKIYLDMDGVLADFVGAVQGPDFLNGPLTGEEHYDENKKEFTEKGLFKVLPPMPDMNVLVNFVKELGIPWEILTCAGAINRDIVVKDKTDWIRKYVDKDVPIHITTKGKEKAKYVDGKQKQILIDDRLENINAWRQAGGTGFLHLNAADTCKYVKQYLDNTK
jgi:5'(3')-deoxyribonucleotidase